MADVLSTVPGAADVRRHPRWVRIAQRTLTVSVVTDEFDDGLEKGNIQNGWAWYTGI